MQDHNKLFAFAWHGLRKFQWQAYFLQAASNIYIYIGRSVTWARAHVYEIELRSFALVGYTGCYEHDNNFLVRKFKF